MRTCTKCKITKNLEHFHKSNKTKDGRREVCKDCRKSINVKNKRQKRNSDLKRNYNITIEDYEKMKEDQDNNCYICKVSENEIRILAVDHCHKTGKVRALLCDKCNTSLGLLKEDKDILHNMLAYINKHNTTSE